MKKVKKTKKECNVNFSKNCSNGCGFYGLGFLGAVIYYISTAPSFGMGILGILKSIVWPVFLVYELLKFIGA